MHGLAFVMLGLLCLSIPADGDPAPKAAAAQDAAKEPAANPSHEAAVPAPEAAVKPAEKPAAQPVAAAQPAVEKPAAKPAVKAETKPADTAAAAKGAAEVEEIDDFFEASSAETEDVPEILPLASVALKDAGGAVPEGAVRKAGKHDLWRVGAGMLWRSIKTRSWRGGSYARNYPIADKSSDHSEGGGRGAYTDGYVESDEWTGLDGETWNWGYDSPGQVEGNTLRLTSSGRVVTEFDRDTHISESVYSDSGENEPGVYVFAQRKIFREPNWDCRLHLDFMRIGSSVSGAAANFRDEQRWETREESGVDVYSLEGAGIAGDSAPYQGNYSDPGPCISTVPLGSSNAGGRVLDEGSYTAYNAIKHDLDLQLLTFSMGLSFNYQFRRLNLGGATGPTINLAETDAVYEETLYESWNGAPASVLKEWRDAEDETETIFGYFVQAEAGLRLTSWVELGVFGRYDWLENINCDIGPSRYVVNPEGGSLGGSLSLIF